MKLRGTPLNNSMHASAGNSLLAGLPSLGRQRFLARCEVIEIHRDQVLSEPAKSIPFVYFPIDCVINLITTLSDGARLEVGLIGDNGMLGISLFLGIVTWSQLAVVQTAGTALRISAAAFHGQCKENVALRERLNRYVYAVTTQRALMMACACHHATAPRLARCLLTTRDRVHSTHFQITHATLAELIGVLRPAITVAASEFQEHGLIRYSRGYIEILDDAGLEQAACGCYQQLIDLYEMALN